MEVDSLINYIKISLVFLFSILIYICLFKIKTPIQYYVKFGTYSIIVMAMAIVFAPVACIRPLNTKNIDLVAKILTFLFRIFDIDVQLENKNYFQSDKPYIVIMNHQSSIDFMTMMKIWPGGNCTPLAKKELFWTGPFGFTIWLCGITFIDRLNAEKARSTIENLAEKINKENLRVWIFPEGTRSPNTRLLPFKKGAFHLAIQAQVPIVCVVTSSYANFYNKRERKFLGGGKVKVKILPPFQTKGMKADSVPNLAKHLQTLMQNELDQLNKDIGVNPKYLAEDYNQTCQSYHKHNKRCETPIVLDDTPVGECWDHKSKKID